jgi:hypothetical protein
MSGIPPTTRYAARSLAEASWTAIAIREVVLPQVDCDARVSFAAHGCMQVVRWDMRVASRKQRLCTSGPIYPLQLGDPLY